MSNSWFQFKQFIIYQDKCAMKVSTDGCIQGAWAAGLCRARSIHNVLDIGTGTGLLSLMLAQELPGATITALEIDQDAFLQAKDNFGQSPWKERLCIRHVPVQEFAAMESGTHGDLQDKFDFIICNPPFFHNQLPSLKEERKLARHSFSLRKEELAENVVRLLDDGGQFCVMYPEREWQEWDNVARQYGLFVRNQVGVKPLAAKSINRVIGCYGKQAGILPAPEDLIIYSSTGVYTDVFTMLMSPFYGSFKR